MTGYLSGPATRTRTALHDELKSLMQQDVGIYRDEAGPARGGRPASRS